MKYFAIHPSIYSAVRASLDARFGHPIIKDGRTITETCLPAADSPDAILATDGRVLVPVNEEFLLLEGVQADIDGLFASGHVEELTEEVFNSLRS
jgi:hypothetical protein